jgi:uncharacterized protein YjiS (DUF1127 family)
MKLSQDEMTAGQGSRPHVLVRLVEALRRRRAALALDKLSDAALKDIGVARCEIPRLATSACTEMRLFVSPPLAAQQILFQPARTYCSIYPRSTRMIPRIFLPILLALRLFGLSSLAVGVMTHENRHLAAGGDYGVTNENRHLAAGGDYGVTNENRHLAAGGDYGVTNESLHLAAGNDYGVTNENRHLAAGGDYGVTNENRHFAAGGDHVVHRASIS